MFSWPTHFQLVGKFSLWRYFALSYPHIDSHSAELNVEEKDHLYTSHLTSLRVCCFRCVALQRLKNRQSVVVDLDKDE